MKICTNHKLLSSLIVAVFFILSLKTHAQSDPSGTRRVSSSYAITNATITTSPGKTIQGATILFKDGLVTAVGTNVSIPKGTDILSGDSLFVYPGFIDGASSAGVSRPSDPERPANFDSSNPTDEQAGITPWRAVLDHHDKQNNAIGDWRKAGFTIAQLIPDGGMISGKAAIITYGSGYSTNILAENTALMARFRGSRGVYPGTPLGVMAKFRDVYKNAELSARHTKLFASNNGLNRPEINKTYQAMYPVLDKNIPVIFEVSNDLETRRALRLQKELGFKLVLSGVTEVEHLISEIKASNAIILLSLSLPEDKTKSKEDATEEYKARTTRVKEAYQQALKQASLLEKEGIKFGFATAGSKSGDFMKNLQIMIENGLSENTALAALTIHNAENLGIQKFAGTLEKGKLANMVITTAPLFSKDAQVKHVIADGYLFDYETKSKKSATESSNTGNTSIAGEWEYTSDTPAGSSGGIMKIEGSGSNLKGIITYDDPTGNGTAQADMKDIKVADNNLSFSFNVSAGGMDIRVNVSGEIDGSQFSGQISLGEFGSFPMNASKKPTSLNF
ncbi:amidohydrolase family protein [Belliella kenyensis]|uniref:Amidohydrolase family protein n=1 Tax=Belliella kenyensis TaxID=1472724 RepID=A0ABV8EIS1_9BACT|nr:amidohydrolase family protein [Belliella kenyensis]MCH7401193.1 amidohydrolase family protein [Belliella kenyensis]MDN3604190.1 amidohydrolase family protein [Belliella kenyensis]